MLIVRLGQQYLTYDDKKVDIYEITLNEDSFDGLMLSLQQLKDYYNKDKAKDV